MGVLVAVVIGMALLAFILGDFLKSGSQVLNKKKYEVGEIDGKSISYVEFETRVQNSVENYKNNSRNNSPDESTLVSIRNQVWNSYLNELIMEDEFSSLGLMCSPEELFDMVQGSNIHPQMRSLATFQNEITGEFDRAMVIQFLKNMQTNPQAKQAWLEFEGSMISDRVYTKYQNLIGKGLYVTRPMIENKFIETNRLYNLTYVSERYMAVADSLIDVSDADIKAFYNENKEDFKQEASVDLAYVTFDIIPSDQDKKQVEEWINNEMEEFNRIPNTKQYINLNSDTGFDEIYHLPSELEESLKAWGEEAEIGSMYGPYLVDNVWKLAKVADMKMIPDSVRASHILILPDANNRFDAAQATADSLVDLINNGADFAELAKEYGTDATAETGGDLDWFRYEGMIPEFSKPAFFGEKGDLTTVTTQHGIHVLQITNQGPKSRKLQVGVLDREITYGQETYQRAYSEASRFAATYNNGEKFEEGVLEENLTKRVANGLREEARAISGLETPRQMIIWAFEAEVNELSKIYEFGDRFVIAKISESRKEGIAPLDQVYGEVESKVINNSKGDYLVEKFKGIGTSDLDALASALSVSVKTIDNVAFGSFSIPGIGVEPKISAAFTTLKTNELSEPIVGASGVYVLKMVSIVEPSTQMDYAASKTTMTQEYTSRAGYQAFQALEKSAKVVDKRNKFY